MEQLTMSDLEPVPERDKKSLREPETPDVIEKLEKRITRRRAAIQSKAKGTRFEYEIRDQIRETYGVKANKTPESGRLGTTMDIDENSAEFLAGDVFASGYIFTIECKNGYDDVELMNLFCYEGERGGKTARNTVLEFIEQADDEVKKTCKQPLIIWKQTNKKAIAGIRASSLVLYENFFS